MNLIIFFGAPGSGKGTQSDFLKTSLNYKKISTGDALREIAGKGTELGNEVAELMSAGKLISDDIVSEVVVSSMQDIGDYKGVILDGYPRTLAQARFLEAYLGSKKGSIIDNLLVIQIDVAESFLVRRICGRYICAKCAATYHKEFRPTKVENICDFCGADEFVSRKDDNEETVKQRLREYHDNFAGIQQFYNDTHKVFVVDGTKDIKEISDEIEKIVVS